MTIARDPLLLDTHVWIWLSEGTLRLSGAIVRRIDQAAAAGLLFVSVMSVWEVGMLLARRRIMLGLALPTWVERALAPPVRLAPLRPEVALECHALPDRFHSDPIDRLLVATARIENLTLVSRDGAILDYAARRHLRALRC